MGRRGCGWGGGGDDGEEEGMRRRGWGGGGDGEGWRRNNVLHSFG